MDPAVRFAVLDGRPGVAVRFQSGPGGLLELVNHTADLRVARDVLRRPGDHARGVLMLELKRVGHGGCLLRIAAQIVPAARCEFGRHNEPLRIHSDVQLPPIPAFL